MNRRSLSKLITLVLPLVLLTSGCGQGKPAKSANPKPAPSEPKLDAVRSAGYPVAMAELNTWYAAPPGDENAASLYLEAFAALSPAEASSSGFLAQNQKALELLHRAAARSECRYPVDLNNGVNTPLPHLASLKKCAQLLSQEAASHAGRGQMELAGQAVLDGLRLARSLEGEPLLISHLVQVASETITVTSLENVLNKRSFSSEQLVRLQSAFAEAENHTTGTRAMAGERALGLAFFQMPAEEQAKVFSQMNGAGSDMEAYRKTPEFDADLDFYLDRMEELVTATGLPFPKSLEAANQWKLQTADAKAKGYVISAMLLPALRMALERTAECAARLRTAQAALAVERYRAAHQNALPDSLAQLSPQFLRAIPADPFDGQPLRYKKSAPAGYVIYSVGKDRSDEGGKPRPAGAGTAAAFDLAFSVRR